MIDGKKDYEIQSEEGTRGRWLNNEQLIEVIDAMDDAAYAVFRIAYLGDARETQLAYEGLSKMLYEPDRGYKQVQSIVKAHPVELCGSDARPLNLPDRDLPGYDELGDIDRLEIAAAYNDDTYVKAYMASEIAEVSGPTPYNLAKKGWVRAKNGENGQQTFNLGDLLRWKLVREAIKG